MKRVPAEFEKQSFIQMIFPHKYSDWVEYLEEARECFVNIINAIRKYQPVLLICDNIDSVKSYFKSYENIIFKEYLTDDTWARDCSAISLQTHNEISLVDFTFNGWGGKFSATKDNHLTSSINYINKLYKIDHELEGGAIESNGAGVLLTTSECLLNNNRTTKTKKEVEKLLNQELGFKEFLWIDNGYLAGDDTDSHIDTLARFISQKRIMYVQCLDKEDEHYEALLNMQKQLQSFSNYTLIPLPMTNPIYFENERLPATYANFLIINGAVLVPVYNDSHDKEALNIFKNSFPLHEIIAIDCSVLIKQHGSLHCVTMQFADGVEISQ